VLKLAASALSGALAVGGMGYSYVNKIETESAAQKALNVSLSQKNDALTAKEAAKDQAISEAIRRLQAVETPGA